jgi:adenylate cyclase
MRRKGKFPEPLIIGERRAHVKEESHCEPRGEIRVKGLAYPVATYGVVDLKANLDAADGAMRTALPHLELRLDPALMSPAERDEAAAALRQALGLLGAQAAEPA